MASRAANPLNFGVLADIHLEPDFQSNLTSFSYCMQMTNTGKTETHEAGEDAHFGRYGCDSNLNLTETMLEAMKRDYGEDLDVILVMGDMVGHSNTQELDPEKPILIGDYDDVIDILTSVSYILHEYFPDVLILPVIGNNDTKYHYMPEFGETKESYYDLLF